MESKLIWYSDKRLKGVEFGAAWKKAILTIMNEENVDVLEVRYPHYSIDRYERAKLTE